MAASIALGRGGKGLFRGSEPERAVTGFVPVAASVYRPDADRRPNSERAGHHSHVAANFMEPSSIMSGTAAHVRRKGYADGRRQRTQCPARAGQLQDEITRLTALGPLPFLSGSTSRGVQAVLQSSPSSPARSTAVI